MITKSCPLFIEHLYLNGKWLSKDDYIKKLKNSIKELIIIIENNNAIKILIDKSINDLDSELVLLDSLLENYSDDLEKIKKDIGIFKLINLMEFIKKL